MSKTRTDLHRGILSRIDEALNSGVGELQSGTGTTPTVVTTATFDIYIDQALGEIYRSCLLLPAQASYTVAVGQREWGFSQMATTMLYSTATTGAKLWALESGRWGTAGLTWASEPAIRRNDPDYRNTTGTPSHFYWDGGEHVGLWRVPTVTGTFTGGGYCIPPSINSQETLTYMYDDLTPMVEDRAATLVAEKQFNDASLFGRLSHLYRRYNELRQREYDKLPAGVVDTLRLAPPAKVG